ncbi:MAG: ATP-binding protein [Thermogemmata sp.]|nr:ATP-binding protein [Thermogemmata sp.]
MQQVMVNHSVNYTEQTVSFVPICSTMTANQARLNPANVLKHYEHLYKQLWPTPELDAFAKLIFDRLDAGRTSCATLTGPYGFGKTAAGILLWHQACEAGYIAIPPLSCVDYDELAAGVASLATVLLPERKSQIKRLYGEIFADDIERVASIEAQRHALPVRKLRKVLEYEHDQGRWAPNKNNHRLVEFLARLGQLSARWSRGLLVIVDELQRLLGPLDIGSLNRLRELVWGMRTEQSPYAVIFTLDVQLETRLALWAADLLHRLREDSPALQMTEIFNSDFPAWLWKRLSTSDKRTGNTFPASAVDTAVLKSLGQFIERPDLANGPRTVIEVFNRAVQHFRQTGRSYGVLNLVDDIYQGRLRFFGEGSPVRRLLIHLLSDRWIHKDVPRQLLVRILAAYPQGCPAEILHTHICKGRKLKIACDQLFGPLLVKLPTGLALEQLQQQVPRGDTVWESTLARCWQSMPGISALAEMAPELVRQILLPKLFVGLCRAGGKWVVLESDVRARIAGFQIFRGSFDAAFPAREVAVWVDQREPIQWPDDVDLCIGFICRSETEWGTRPSAEITNLEGIPRLVLEMPVLVPMDSALPDEIAHYKKYIQPEPLRPVHLLLGLRELQVFDETPRKVASGRSQTRKNPHDNALSAVGRNKLSVFKELCIDHLLRFLVQGEINVGASRPVQHCGPEFLRAFFQLHAGEDSQPIKH